MGAVAHACVNCISIIIKYHYSINCSVFLNWWDSSDLPHGSLKLLWRSRSFDIDL